MSIKYLAECTLLATKAHHARSLRAHTARDGQTPLSECVLLLATAHRVCARTARSSTRLHACTCLPHARICVRLLVPQPLALAATARTCRPRRQRPDRAATSNGGVHTGLVEWRTRPGCTWARAPESNCPDWSLPRAAACPRSAMRLGRDNARQWGTWRAHGEASRLKLRHCFFKLKTPARRARAQRAHGGQTPCARRPHCR